METPQPIPEPLPERPRIRFDSLQVYRGVAALLVVLYHLGGNAKLLYSTTFLWDFFTFGYCGVDFFFVLSGFIIAFTSRKQVGQRGQFLPFLKRRLLRIYPIYWILIGPLILLIIAPRSPIRTGHPSEWDEALSSLLLLFGHWNYNATSWTLTYEVFFYLVFSLVVLSRKLVLIPIIIAALSFVNLLAYPGEWLDRPEFDPVVLEFALGVWIAVYYSRNSSKTLGSERALKLLLLCAWLVIPALRIVDLPEINRVWKWAPPYTLIILLSVFLERDFAIRFPRWWIQLGNASYILYLIHIPVIRIVNKIAISICGTAPAVFYLVNVSLVAILCQMSIWLHHKLESPLIDWLYGLAGLRSRKREDTGSSRTSNGDA